MYLFGEPAAYLKSRAYNGKKPAVSGVCALIPAFAVNSILTGAEEKSSIIKTCNPFSYVYSL